MINDKITLTHDREFSFPNAGDGGGLERQNFHWNNPFWVNAKVSLVVWPSSVLATTSDALAPSSVLAPSSKARSP